MKVAWFETREWHREYIDSRHEIDFYEGLLQEHELERYDAVSVFVNSEVDRGFIESIRPEKILCRSSGYDNVDMAAAEELGVEVYNVPEYGSETVAEYTLSLLLNMSKKLCSDIGKKPGEDGHEGFELKNKTLGVIGAGRIGREVIKRAKAFDMEVLAYDPYPDEKAAEELGYSYFDLEDLLSASDFVSINCPLTDATQHLLSEEQFRLMEGVKLVNTARGEVVDSESLYQALQDGSVAYVALDVVEDERE